jgi:hypothetical protein
MLFVPNRFCPVNLNNIKNKRNTKRWNKGEGEGEEGEEEKRRRGEEGEEEKRRRGEEGEDV